MKIKSIYDRLGLLRMSFFMATLNYVRCVYLDSVYRRYCVKYERQ